jgi:hypothetical protein
MKTFHFFDAASGVFHQSSVMTDLDGSGATAFAALNCPPGHKVHDGGVDPLAQRKDIETGKVIDYVPPSPGADFEWNSISLRWQISAAVQAKADARTAALAGIAALEASQHRAVRELAIGTPGALARLQQIDLLISALRPALGV